MCRVAGGCWLSPAPAPCGRATRRRPVLSVSPFPFIQDAIRVDGATEASFRRARAGISSRGLACGFCTWLAYGLGLALPHERKKHASKTFNGGAEKDTTQRGGGGGARERGGGGPGPDADEGTGTGNVLRQQYCTSIPPHNLIGAAARP